jgi:mannitol/fructose-specific phosphotransferase system IIA component (Ntr-type)
MELREFFSQDAIKLDLEGSSKDEILKELIGLLKLDEKSEGMLWKVDGLDFKAIDEKPVRFFFLIVAPPLEVSNQYLPVLGKIAQFSKEPDVPDRLLAISSPAEFMQLLEEKGV